MKLTILGSGVCASQLPGIPNRFPPGFLVEWGNEKVLFDCSEGIRFRLEQAGFDYTEIGHVAITHPHPDHYAFAHFYQSAVCNRAWSKRPYPEMTLYAPDKVIADWPSLWKMYTPEGGTFFDLTKLSLYGMSSGKEVHSIGDGKLSAKPVHHGFGEVDAVAYRLETPDGIFAYSGDTGDCPGIREVAKDADIFVCEASARIGNEAATKNYGHLTPLAAGSIAREAGVKKLILVHYTGLDSDEKMMKDVERSGFSGETVIGQDFMEFPF